MTADGEYVLATGDAAAPRLALLEKIYGASTSLLLAEAGLKPGMNVVEMGCGTGLTTCSLAEAVGPAGRVLAIDISAEQLNLARANARRAGLDNIEFIEGSATSTGLASESADLLYCRLLFSHIRQVGEAIMEFKRLLKVGGALACEELAAAAAYSTPESAVFARLREIAIELSAKTGTDYSIGRRLPQLVRTAGLEVRGVRTVQRSYYTGEEKRWWEWSFREVSPSMVKAGVLDPAEQAELLAALEVVAMDDDVLVTQPAMMQVLARRTAAGPNR